MGRKGSVWKLWAVRLRACSGGTGRNRQCGDCVCAGGTAERSVKGLWVRGYGL